MIIYSAPIGALALPAPALDISARGAASIPRSEGAWLAPHPRDFDDWRALLHRADTALRGNATAAARLRLAAWEQFEEEYLLTLTDYRGRRDHADEWRALLALPAVCLCDHGDGRPVHPSLPPCDPRQTGRAVARAVLAGLGAVDGGEVAL